MRAVIQRVTSASVTIDGQKVAECGVGYLALMAVHNNDTDENAQKLAAKIATLRILADPEGKLNLALADVHGAAVLAVPNFTLFGDASGQRRPSFVESAPFELGKRLFDAFVEALRSHEVAVQTGVFGADMQVELVNDGPVTLIIET